MNAHKVETVLNQDGTLTITHLPFPAGTVVEVIVLERSTSLNCSGFPPSDEGNLYILQGSQPYQYDDPFAPATPSTDWEALK